MKPETHSPPVRDLVAVFAALIVLLGLSAGTAALPPAAWKTGASLVIAVIKTALVALFFMRLREQRGLIRVFASAGLFWLAILVVLVFSDYLTRGWR